MAGLCYLLLVGTALASLEGDSSALSGEMWHRKVGFLPARREGEEVMGG
jgi:hypothetical protein